MAPPSFIVLGAVKAGTTSLYNYLGQHPEIQMSAWNWPRYFHVAAGTPNFADLSDRYGDTHRAESEGRYEMMFPARIPRSMEQYEALWPDTDATLVQGEVSPTYLHDPGVCAQIAARKPKTKLLIVLRNPVDRAYSHFVMDRRKGWEQIDNFGEALNKEPVHADNFFWGRRHYIRHGLYASIVEKYMESFSRDQIKIMFYEDLVRDPSAYLAEILDFIGVDPGFTIDTSTQHNKGVVKRNTPLSRILYADFPGRQFIKRRLAGPAQASISKKIAKSTHATPGPMQPHVRQELAQIFAEDVHHLQSMVDRDLSSWVM